MSIDAVQSRRPVSLLLALTGAVMSGACAQGGLPLLASGVEETAALAAKPTASPSPAPATAAPGATETKGRVTVSKALRPVVADAESGPLAEARALRLSGRKADALVILDKAVAAGNKSEAVVTERALLALDLGQIGKAEPLLKTLAQSRSADWRIHSAYGSALAAAGRHQEAQLQFAKALTLAPDHPSVLNNLALSYALDGKAEEAEKLLHRVAARDATNPERMARQNLALIVALKGRTEEATRISAKVLPEDQARANAELVGAGASTSSPARADRVAAHSGFPDQLMRVGAPKD